ncbi:MAG: hypothetical protein K2X38_06305 [Gemmataceae bacterium]|nr:hypothetical protein [Gemmataceae bacterium]
MKPIRRFVKKCCIVAENARYPAIELYLTYVNWCLNAGVAIHDQFAFLEMLQETGFSCNRQKSGAWFEGITVLPNYRVE